MESISIDDLCELLQKGAAELGLTLSPDAAYQIAHISSGDARAYQHWKLSALQQENAY